MSSEITRASDADRERFAQHLSYLYAKGYISETEAEELLRRILDARSLTVLRSTISGFPQPEQSPKRDWCIPENFVPPCVAAAVTGALIAVIPATALAHREDGLSNVLAATSIIIGIAIFFAALIVAIGVASHWDDIGEAERERRREANKRR